MRKITEKEGRESVTEFLTAPKGDLISVIK